MKSIDPQISQMTQIYKNKEKTIEQQIRKNSEQKKQFRAKVFSILILYFSYSVFCFLKSASSAKSADQYSFLLLSRQPVLAHIEGQADVEIVERLLFARTRGPFRPGWGKWFVAAQDQFDHPAAADVVDRLLVLVPEFGAAAMTQNCLFIAIGIEQGIGQDRHLVECSFLENALCQLHDRAGLPGW